MRIWSRCLARADATGFVNRPPLMTKGRVLVPPLRHAYFGQHRQTQTTPDRLGCSGCPSDENGRFAGLGSGRRIQSVCQTVCLLATLSISNRYFPACGGWESRHFAPSSPNRLHFVSVCRDHDLAVVHKHIPQWLPCVTVPHRRRF